MHVPGEESGSEQLASAFPGIVTCRRQDATANTTHASHACSTAQHSTALHTTLGSPSAYWTRLRALRMAAIGYIVQHSATSERPHLRHRVCAPVLRRELVDRVPQHVHAELQVAQCSRRPSTATTVRLDDLTPLRAVMSKAEFDNNSTSRSADHGSGPPQACSESCVGRLHRRNEATPTQILSD